MRISPTSPGVKALMGSSSRDDIHFDACRTADRDRFSGSPHGATGEGNRSRSDPSRSSASCCLELEIWRTFRPAAGAPARSAMTSDDDRGFEIGEEWQSDSHSSVRRDNGWPADSMSRIRPDIESAGAARSDRRRFKTDAAGITRGSVNNRGRTQTLRSTAQRGLRRPCPAA